MFNKKISNNINIKKNIYIYIIILMIQRQSMIYGFLFILACVVLGLSIWAFIVPCIPENFKDYEVDNSGSWSNGAALTSDGNCY